MSKATNARTRTSTITKRSRKAGGKNKLKAAPKSGLGELPGFDAGTAEISAQKFTFLKNLSALAKLY
jgi:hypothetical protein